MFSISISVSTILYTDTYMCKVYHYIYLYFTDTRIDPIFDQDGRRRHQTQLYLRLPRSGMSYLSGAATEAEVPPVSPYVLSGMSRYVHHQGSVWWNGISDFLPMSNMSEIDPTDKPVRGQGEMGPAVSDQLSDSGTGSGQD